MLSNWLQRPKEIYTRIYVRTNYYTFCAIWVSFSRISLFWASRASNFVFISFTSVAATIFFFISSTSVCWVFTLFSIEFWRIS